MQVGLENYVVRKPSGGVQEINDNLLRSFDAMLIYVGHVAVRV